MKNNALVIIMALLIASFLTLAYFQLQRPSVETVSVLTATRPIASGEKIMPIAITWQKQIKGKVKPGYITQKNQLKAVIGSISKKDVSPGQPLLLNEIKIIPGGIPAKLLDNGMYAVSVGFPQRMALARLITKGDKIDILLMRKEGDMSYIKPILSDIQILNIAPPYPEDQDEEDKKSQRKKRFPSVLVLSMTSEQVKVLNLAQGLGTLRFLLKSAHQNGLEPHYFDYMIANKKKPKMEVEDELYGVEIIRGTSKTKKVMQ